MDGMQENLVWHVKLSLSCFLLACISCIAPLTRAGSDMMAKNQRISDGQTLVSSGGNFVLGFFSPSNSKHRYVGIWYGKVSVKTIIWVANRERPLAEPTGALALNNDGSLVVMDWRGGFISIAYGSDRSVNTSAKLLDNGNLILSEGNGSNDGRIVWQSFDYPTDTFLPGMKAGLNLRTKQNRVLISWRSEEDPAPGVYSFGSDPNGSAKFFIWQDGTIYWVCWTFSKNSFEFKSGPKYHFNYSFETDGDEQYFSYSLSNKSVISRLLLDPYGQIKQYVWSEDIEKWNVLWSFPTDRCDVYAPCGANGICNTNSSTLCKCPQGFEPVSPKAWASNSWSDGCQRQEKLKCGKTAGFLQLKNTKFPDQMQLVAGIDHDIRVCEAACRANCSCVAYSSANTSGCLFWSGDLMGLRENYSGVYGEPDIFIRVAASVLDESNDPSHGRRSKSMILAVISTVVTLGFLISGCFAFYFWRRRRMVNAKEKELLQLQIATGITAASKFNNKSSFLKEGKGYDIKLFSFSSIAAATNNFSEANKLGEGGFGPVYRGKLFDGHEIAVKRLSRNSCQGILEFANEIKLIAKLQHMNLVRLWGCCIQTEEKILIYEYMPNRSLDSFLFDPTKQRTLDWGKRVRIIEGIAQGLLYLHKYSRLRVIHRDLKASNILLDGEMNPKISDFGMARIFGHNESVANTKRIVGTYGYMSPEYGLKGLFSEKSDVFSFGVLLLEIISGKKNSSFDSLDCSLNFLGYAWEMWKEGTVELLMDPILSESTSGHSLNRYIHVALLCVQESAFDRPTMLDVVNMLGNEAAPLLDPKQPAFFFANNVAGSNSPNKDNNEVCSSNCVTISLAQPR